tara:strand:+ start:76693 stop:77646 length:954 start_codon:yes stop_codon:yes gene_type:complete
MSVADDFWFMMHFKLKLHQLSGEAFQQLFNDLMEAQYGADYCPVQPWGSQGDGGNDGFLKSEGLYFQVYGPSSHELNPARAATKAAKDFEKLKANWPDLKAYTFVFNDRFRGVPPPVLEALRQVSEAYDIPTDCMKGGDLERLFLELSDAKKAAIVNGVPTTLPAQIDPRFVGDLLTHLADRMASVDTELMSDSTAPDFDEKLEFNGLPERFRHILKSASYQLNSVEVFFNNRPGMAQQIRDEVAAIYNASLTDITGNFADASADRFVYILNKLLPPCYKDHCAAARIGLESVAYVVMAKYFETCDLYERPLSTPST